MGKRKASGSLPRGPVKFRKKASLVKRVSKLERSREKKYYDFALKATEATGAHTVAGTVHRLNLVPLGDGVAERDGREIWMQSIQLRMAIETEEVTGLPNVRTIILYDKSDDGGTLSGANYLDYSTIINGDEALAPLRQDKLRDIQVLYDDLNGSNKDSMFQASGTAAGASVYHIVSNAWRKIDKPTTFNSTSGIAQYGSLILLLVGNQWASATTSPKVRMNLVTRVAYTDS